jgi:heat shock protein HslJ
MLEYHERSAVTTGEGTDTMQRTTMTTTMVMAGALAGATLLGACAARQAPASGGVAAPITVDAVAGATIRGAFDTPITLKDGRYEGPPFVPGGASRPTATLLASLTTLGELDDVPGADAAAVVASNEGGSGENILLTVVGMRGGKATSVGSALVGDRTKIRDLRISGRDIVLDVVEIGPRDAACCATQLATKTYRMQGGALRMIGSATTGTVSVASTIGGRTWTAVEIDGTPVPAGSPAPTLTYEGGRISGTSGCNQYTGALTEAEPGTVTVGPIAGTRRLCAEEAANTTEVRYLKALQGVTRYTFLAGRLHLSGGTADATHTILFAKN